MIQLKSDVIKVKDNGQWGSLDSLTGPQGPQGPQGPSGASDWEDLENKPFEGIGEGLTVDSEGLLNVDSSGGNYMVKGVDYVTAGLRSGTTLGESATAEGSETTASGNHSHAEGYGTIASNYDAHAEGNNTTASGQFSHSEGRNTVASGGNSHAEGWGTVAQKDNQHVFGKYNIAENTQSWVSGVYVEIVGNGSSDGNRSNARTLDWNGNEVLAGKLTVGAGPTNNMDVATKQYVDSQSGGTPDWSNVDNKPFEDIGSGLWVDDGYLTADAPEWNNVQYKPFETIGNGLSVTNDALNVDPIDYSDIQNKPTIPDSTSDLVNDSGFITNTVNNLVNYTPSSSLSTVATSGSYSDLSNKPSIPDSTSDLTNDSGFITESDIPDWDSLDNKPFETLGSGLSVSSEGVLSSTGGSGASDWDDLTNKPFESIGSGLSVDSEGVLSATGGSGNYMVRGVDYVTAGQLSGSTLGIKATAEGYNTTASGAYSHAEGSVTIASGSKSHAEGESTTAGGYSSHAEGQGTTTLGLGSHAEGVYTSAHGQSQHVFGKFNIVDTAGSDLNVGTYIEIVGNGTSNDTRHNARTLDWSGNEVLAGKLTVGAGPTNAMDVATKQYVDNASSTPDWSDVANKPFDTIGSGLSVDSEGELSADIPTNVSDLTNDAGYITAGIFSYDSTTGVLSITTV